MIVVIGAPGWRAAEPAGPAGRACALALACAGRGARVELVGRAGEDAAGDALMIGLARAGVGHAALLRDPARPTPIVEAPRVADEESVTSDAVAAVVAAIGSAGPELEPADVSLALRYLDGYSVIVVTDDVAPSIVPIAAEAAAFADAHLVVLVAGGAVSREMLPRDATVFEAPAVDPDRAFAAIVGSYAAALDAGRSPSDAFAAALPSVAAQPVLDRTRD